LDELQIFFRSQNPFGLAVNKKKSTDKAGCRGGNPAAQSGEAVDGLDGPDEAGGDHAAGDAVGVCAQKETDPALDSIPDTCIVPIEISFYSDEPANMVLQLFSESHWTSSTFSSEIETHLGEPSIRRRTVMA
jgi:hypothetical protein